MDFNFDNKLEDDGKVDELSFKINIRVQQRNGRKSWTSIEGLENIKDIDLKKFTKSVKKKLCCNGSIHTLDTTSEKVTQFQGDHREDIKNLLIKTYNVSEDSIIIHGF